MRPYWNDPSTRFGTRIRIALWLLDEVGEGRTFTKAQLRAAFPGVEQVDRRMRDLRDSRWKIETNREDPGLPPDTLRFAQAGDPVWDPRASSTSGPHLTRKARSAVMAGDDFLCTVCGIAGGEVYPDSPRQETAQLSVSRRRIEFLDGSEQVCFVTECSRCKAGSTEQAEVPLGEILADIDGLPHTEREELAEWIRRERRQPRRVDQLWSEYRRLPADARRQIASRLKNQA